MDVGNGDTWTGDWDGFDQWVQGLFPNPHHLADDEEDADPPEWPNAIEIHVGSRGVSNAPEKRVDVATLEPVDATNLVASGVQEVLNSRAGAHTSVVIKLTATTQDEEGKEGEWAQAGNIIRVFNRAVTVHTNTASPPRVPSPTPSPPAPWESPPAASPPAAPIAVPGGYAPPAVPGYAPPAVPGAQAVPFSSPQGTPDLGTQALLFAFQSLQANAANLMAEHRFLIDQNTAMVDRVISVHEAAVQGMAREASASRTSMERMNSEMMGLHKDTMTAQSETERVRLEADKRAESLERNRVDNENAALRENLAKVISQFNGLQEDAATQDQDDPGSDPIRAQVASAASQVLNAVMAELAGKGQKEEGATPNQPNSATQETNQETGTPRRRRRRRPGVPGVRPVDTDPEPSPPKPDSGGGGLGFDIANVTPQQAAMVLAMLPEDTRKTALQTLVNMNRALAIQMGKEFADAVDEHDGV